MKRVPCIAALVFASLPALGQASGIAYDVRVFYATCATPVPIQGNDRNGIEGFDLQGIIRLADCGATPENGLRLNDAGGVLFWDKKGAPAVPGVACIAAQDNLPNRTAIAIDTGERLQYIDYDDRNRFVLRETAEPAGYTLALAYAGNGATRVSLSERFSTAREPVPGVRLDVGKPKPGTNANLLVRSPDNVWEECIVFGRNDTRAGQFLVFVRVHATPEALAKEVQFPVEQYSIELKIFGAPKKTAAKLKEIIVPDPEVRPIAGSAQVIKNFNVGEKVIAADDPVRVLELVNSFKGVELLSAPRVTVFSERSSRIRNGPSENNDSRPASKHYISPFDAVPILDEFLKLRRHNAAIVADTVSNPADKPARVIANPNGSENPANSPALGQWSGIVWGVSLDPGPQPNTVSLDLAVVMRQRVRNDFHDTGFRFQLMANLGKSLWFTTANDHTGERIVQATIEQVPYDSSNRFHEAPDGNGGVGGFAP